MEISHLDITSVRPYEKNAKLHDAKQIANVAKSIKKYGWQQPIVVDADGCIIIGHCRLEAAKKLGMETVPCVRADDLTPAQVRELRLLDNKLNESAWDFDLLAAELPDLDFAGFDIDWDLPTAPEETVAEDDGYEVELPEEPKSKYGEVYQLGRHRLMCGDSTKPEDVARLMDGAKADLLLTDPPYNVDYTGKTADALKIKNDKMEDTAFRSFLFDAFENARESMKPGACFYIWHADSEGANFRLAAKEAGLMVRQCLIWAKNTIVMGRQDYQWKHEPCLYGWKDGASHLWASDRKQSTILNFDKPTRNDLHPTMKPIPLFDYQICNNTKGGDIVLDLFGGSGTTLMACEQNGRTAYIKEYDPRYVDVIIDRWETFTGEKAVKISGPERDAA